MQKKFTAKVSVRDNYTIEERELIKEWVKKAEQKNKEENTYCIFMLFKLIYSYIWGYNNTQAWKVRGTQKKYGLRLVKITKRT